MARHGHGLARRNELGHTGTEFPNTDFGSFHDVFLGVRNCTNCESECTQVGERCMVVAFFLSARKSSGIYQTFPRPGQAL
jgi:hypothetical protein